MKLDSKLVLTDPILKKIMLDLPKPSIISTNNVFHDLMSCIIEQQIHYRSTKKIFEKMLNLANLKILSPENYQHFEQKSFSNLKLSESKYETIDLVLKFWENNNINWQDLNENEIIDILSSIKGIGKWTIDMVLLFTLQRPNIFPYDDFHVKQIMVSLYGLDPKVKLRAQMVDISKNWGNQKSVAVLYLLDWKKLNKK